MIYKLFNRDEKQQFYKQVFYKRFYRMLFYNFTEGSFSKLYSHL